MSAYRHDRSCLELYASCLTPMALEPIKCPEQKLVGIFGLIRQSMITFTSLAKRRKSFHCGLYSRPIIVYTCRSRENGRFDGARTRPYSQAYSRYYAGIIYASLPPVSSHLLTGLHCCPPVSYRFLTGLHCTPHSTPKAQPSCEFRLRLND